MIIKTVEDLRNALRGIPDDYEIKISDGNLRLNVASVTKIDEKKLWRFFWFRRFWLVYKSLLYA